MKNTLDFLKNLASNNTREWIQDHKDIYLTSRQQFEIIVGNFIQKIAEFDVDIKGIEAKSCLFRLNRDVRFSKDKSPYKTHYGAWICGKGKKSPGPGYYLHIEPEKSFMAVGIYMPDADMLKKIRQEIDYNGDTFQSVISEKHFSSLFENTEIERTKNAPKGFDTNHPLIEWIKNKHFIMSHSIDDETFNNTNWIEEHAKMLKHAYPFIKFLKEAVE